MKRKKNTSSSSSLSSHGEHDQLLALLACVVYAHVLMGVYDAGQQKK